MGAKGSLLCSEDHCAQWTPFTLVQLHMWIFKFRRGTINGNNLRTWVSVRKRGPTLSSKETGKQYCSTPCYVHSVSRTQATVPAMRKTTCKYIHKTYKTAVIKWWNLAIWERDGYLQAITNSVEQSPSWEAESHSASQENFLPYVETLKVHYCAHNSLPLVPILCHMHPVHTFPPNFSKIQPNIIFPSMPRSFEWSGSDI